MPQVRVLTSVAGETSYNRGDLVELSPAAAASWVEAGMAELVREEQPQTPERSAAAPETTAVTSRAARARGSKSK